MYIHVYMYIHVSIGGREWFSEFWSPSKKALGRHARSLPEKERRGGAQLQTMTAL